MSGAGERTDIVPVVGNGGARYSAERFGPAPERIWVVPRALRPFGRSAFIYPKIQAPPLVGLAHEKVLDSYVRRTSMDKRLEQIKAAALEKLSGLKEEQELGDLQQQPGALVH